MTRSSQERFADILEAIQRCQDYEPYLRSHEFAKMAYDAVLRNLAVIGEAVRALPSDTRDRIPDIPGLDRRLAQYRLSRVLPREPRPDP